MQKHRRQDRADAVRGRLSGPVRAFAVTGKDDFAMNTAKPVFHGSDLEKVEAVYGIPAKDIVPFGGNVNPLGLSPMLRESLIAHIDDITGYPDREYTALREAISGHVGAPADRILVGSGATELISLIMQTKRPRQACILEPTYSEYRREIQLGGGTCYDYLLEEGLGFLPDPARLLEDLAARKADLLIMCNPNNPTSSCADRQRLSSILEGAQKLGILVFVDETYIEFTPDPEALTAAPLTNTYANLVVLGGVSKFFAAPGLRLGYGIFGDLKWREELKDMQNPWSVHTLAATCGGVMFRDRDYILRSRSYIAKERDRCYEAVKAIPGLQPVPPRANFMLVKITDPRVTSGRLFEACISRGLMIRDCSTFPALGDRYIRFCFLKEEDNTRLLDTLRETMESAV